MTPHSGRLGLAFLATFALLVSTVGVVAAAAPDNDAAALPTVIADVPFSDSLDTTEATSEPVDPGTCVANSHTVWYQLTATTTEDLLVHTFGSDFDIVVHVGTPAGGGAMDVIACVDDSGGTLQAAVRFLAEAGTTYLIAVGSFLDSNGGNLVLDLDVAPPPLEIELTIEAIGSFHPTGIARIGGTVTCSVPAPLGYACTAIECAFVTAEKLVRLRR